MTTRCRDFEKYKTALIARFYLRVVLIAVFLAIAAGTLVAQNGTALQFNAPGSDQGKQFVNLGQNLKLGDPTINGGAFTIETWFKHEGLGWWAMLEYPNTPQVFAVPLIARGNWNSTNYFLGVDYHNRVLVADFDDATGSGHPIYGHTIIGDDKWYHAAAVYDGSTWFLYLDGNLEATLYVGQVPKYNVAVNTSLATAITSGTNISVGSAYNGWFQGSMDEARFWNVARTAQQILDNKNKEIPSAQGLLARYGLNEGGGTAAHDSSGSVPAFDGTLMSHSDNGGGNPATWVTGSPFQAGSVKSANRALGLNLLGNPYMPGNLDPKFVAGYVDLGTNPVFGLSTFTVEAWMNWTGGGDAYLGSVHVPAGTGKYGSAELYGFPIVAKGYDSGGNYFLGLTRGNPGDGASDAQLFAFFQSSSNKYSFPIVLSSQRIPKNGWHHVAATFDGAQLQLYIDGAPDGQAATLGLQPTSTGTAPFAIGGGYGYGQFAGQIEQVHVWNYARSLSQIADNRTIYATAPEYGLVARWAMDGGGSPIIDLGGTSAAGGAISGNNWMYVPGLTSPLFTWTDMNHAPVLTDPGSQTSNQGDTVSLQIVASDADHDALAYSAAGLPSGLSIFSGSGLITGNATTNGTYNVTVTVTDNTVPVTQNLVWTVNHVSLPPIAANDSYSMVGDGMLSVPAPGVLANDTDPNGLTLSAALVAGPAHGTLLLNANGSFTYTPTLGYSGTDTFTYLANNGTANSNAATVSIFITPRNYPPDTPFLIAPQNGATGVPIAANLDVTVSDPNLDAMTVQFYGKKIGGLPSDFTVVMLPDTQWYSSGSPQTFNAQTQWAVNNRQALNIKFVTQVGDITNGNSDYEWQNASNAMGILDAAGVPNNFALGNHDCCNGAQPFGSAGSDQYFPVSRYASMGNNYGYLGSDPVADAADMPRDAAGNIVPNGNRSNYELFSAGYLDFIILHLELDTPNGAAYPSGGSAANVMHWADRILTKYANRRAMITMHVYIEPSGGRASAPFLRHDGTGTSAEQVWQQLIIPHCNVFMTNNGHDAQGMGDEGMRVDNNSCGQPVYQIMFDPEDRDNWFGDGWLRYYTFHAAQNTIEAFTYSPTLNPDQGGTYEENPPNCCKYNGVGGGHFTLSYDMGAPVYQLIDTKTAASGSHATTTWSNLDPNTQYSWYVQVSDNVNPPVVGPNWGFTTGSTVPVPAAITSPVNGTTLTAASTTFTWTPGSGVTGYYLWVGTTPGVHDLVNVYLTGTSFTATLPTTGATVYVRLYSKINGIAVLNSDFTYTEFTVVPAGITSPVNGNTLTAASTTFTWTPGSGATSYYLWVGTAPGVHDLVNVNLTGTSYTATLPTTGATVYVRLYSKINGIAVLNSDFTYTEFTVVPAGITSPVSGTTLTAASTTFTWTPGTGGVTGYYLWVGTTSGVHDLVNVYLTGTSFTATLPTTGATVYVRLYSKINGIAVLNSDFTYTEFTVVPAGITSPVSGTTLTAASTTFTWTPGSGATSYYLWVGTAPGVHDLVNVNLASTSYTATLPTTGATIYVRLYSAINGIAVLNSDFSYTEFTVVPAGITSPVNGNTLTAASTTFTWTPGSGATSYYLWVGTAPGVHDLVNVNLTGTSYTATLPTTGATVYVRLYSKINGIAVLNSDFTYTEFTVVPAGITSPVSGTTLTAASTTFTWTPGTGGVTGYYLWVGTTSGVHDLVNVYLTGTSFTATLPTTGATVYVRLYSKINGIAVLNSDFTYTEFTVVPAGITSPVSGTTLTAASTTFTWTPGSGATSYYLWVGTAPGVHDLVNVNLASTSYTATLPTTGATIYVRLYSAINGIAVLNSDFSYTEYVTP